MLDIDILTSPNPTLKQFIIYSYESLRFKREVEKKILNGISSKVNATREVLYEDFITSISEVSFFGIDNIIVNLDTLFDSAKLSKDIFTSLSGWVESKSISNRILFLIDRSGPHASIIDSTEFKKIKKHSTFIEEVDLKAKSSVTKLIAYLQDRSELVNFSKIDNIELFNEMLHEFISLNQGMSLPNFINKFELFCVICFDNDKFNSTKLRSALAKERPIDYFKFHSIFFGVCAGDEESKKSLFREVDKLLNKELKEPREVLGLLNKSIKELLLINSVLNKNNLPDFSKFKLGILSKFNSAAPASLLKLIVTFARFEPKLITKNFMINFKFFIDSV